MADRQLIRPLVSIAVPCYHNLAQARRCVSSILAQSWREFELTLIDDGASDEYREYVETLGDPRVRYRRNPSRLGAMRNMFQAIGAGSGTYTLAFHEDDLLGARYLESAVGILERDPKVGFVTAQLREFESEPSAAQLAAPADPPAYDLFASPADFLRAILDGLEPMFGAVVYRRAALAGVLPAHDEYGTLVDRPFLMTIMERWSGAIVRDPLVWYRRHADTVRHEGMSADHIVRLFSFYRSTLPAPMSARDRALFYTYSGYWLFALYDLTPDNRRPSFGRFLLRVWRGGLYQAKWRGRFGLRLLQRAVLGQGSSAS
jgi:glycosyltransferase involved in cell wall biosynthesis